MAQTPEPNHPQQRPVVKMNADDEEVDQKQYHMSSSVCFQEIVNIMSYFGQYVIVCTLSLIFISFCNLFNESVLKKTNYLSPEENWLLFIHSVMTIVSQLRLSSYAHDCEVGAHRDTHLDIDIKVFKALMAAEFIFITGTVLVYFPLRGISFGICVQLLICVLRFLTQIVILSAIQFAKRDFDDKRVIHEMNAISNSKTD